MSAGAVIKSIRVAMDLSQAELGALVGEGRWYIRQVERNKRPL